MLDVNFDKENELLTITINGESETLPLTEFLSLIPSHKTRIEELLYKIDQIKKMRITKMEEVIRLTEKMLSAQGAIRDKMVEATENEDYQALKALQKVHTSIKNERAVLSEITKAVKMLHEEEAKLMTELLDLEES